MARSNRQKNNLCPLPCATVDGVTISHSVSFIHVAHMLVLIQNNLQLYGLPVGITEISLWWGVVHVCQHMYITFVPPQYCCQANPSSYMNVALFEFHFVGA